MGGSMRRILSIMICCALLLSLCPVYVLAGDQVKLPVPTGLRWESGQAIWNPVAEAIDYGFGFEHPGGGYSVSGNRNATSFDAREKFIYGSGRYAFRVMSKGTGPDTLDSDWSDWCEVDYIEPIDKLAADNMRWEIVNGNNGSTRYVAHCNLDERAAYSLVTLLAVKAGEDWHPEINAYSVQASGPQQWDFTPEIKEYMAAGNDPLYFYFHVVSVSNDILTLASSIDRGPGIVFDNFASFDAAFQLLRINMERSGHDALNNARNEARLIKGKQAWDPILTGLATDTLVEKAFKADDVGSTELLAALEDAFTIDFLDPDSRRQGLADNEQKHQATLQMMFGDKIKVSNLVAFLLAIQEAHWRIYFDNLKDDPDVISRIEEITPEEWAQRYNAFLLPAIHEVSSSPEYAALADTLYTELSWYPDLLNDAGTAFFNTIDPSGEARMAISLALLKQGQ